MKRKNRCVVFFDFDNTIATVDVFDDIVLRFAKDKNWIALEKKWRKGQIGSKECLKGQLESVRVEKMTLDKYLAGIKLDPYFKKVIKFLQHKGIRVIVLSDNFGYLLRSILKHNSIQGLKVYSNSLGFAKDRLIPGFPFENKNCRVCAHCKTKNLLANSKEDSIIFYIGDGRSDICPAICADIVFAKESLLDYFKSSKLACLPYKGLKEVYKFFKRSLQ